MDSQSSNQFSGLDYALDTVGGRWTLLIIHELMGGPRRFTDLLEGLPGISTNLLTQRLKWLEERGVIRHYTLARPSGSKVYELTKAGAALQQAVAELEEWGSHFMPASLKRDMY